MKRWTDIGSDCNWADYGGKWARKAKDGAYYILDFTNMYDACGEGECKRATESGAPQPSMVGATLTRRSAAGRSTPPRSSCARCMGSNKKVFRK